MSACRNPYVHTCKNLSLSLGKQKMKHFLMLNSNYYISQLHNTSACCLFTCDGPIMQSGLQVPAFSLNNLSCALRALVYSSVQSLFETRTTGKCARGSSRDLFHPMIQTKTTIAIFGMIENKIPIRLSLSL